MTFFCEKILVEDIFDLDYLSIVQNNKVLAVMSYTGMEQYYVDCKTFDWIYTNWMSLNPIPMENITCNGFKITTPGMREENVYVRNLPIEIQALYKMNNYNFIKTLKEVLDDEKCEWIG